MKAKPSRFTNTGKEACEECFAQPGEVHVLGCITGNRDVIVDSSELRNKLSEAGREHLEHLAHLARLDELVKELHQQGIPKAIVRRALEDLGKPDHVRAKHDTAHMIARAALGCPLQMDALDDGSIALGRGAQRPAA